MSYTPLDDEAEKLLDINDQLLESTQTRQKQQKELLSQQIDDIDFRLHGILNLLATGNYTAPRFSATLWVRHNGQRKELAGLPFCKNSRWYFTLLGLVRLDRNGTALGYNPENKEEADQIILGLKRIREDMRLKPEKKRVYLLSA